MNKKQLSTRALRLLDKHALDNVTGGGRDQLVPGGKDPKLPPLDNAPMPNGRDQ
jgi:hypothetical protein